MRNPAEESKKLFFSRNGLLGASNAASSDAHNSSATAGKTPAASAPRGPHFREWLRTNRHIDDADADIMNATLLSPLPCQRRQRAAFAIARVLVVDPVVRVDPLDGNAVARPQQAPQDPPRRDLRPGGAAPHA